MKVTLTGRQRLALPQAINSKVVKTAQDIADCTIMLNVRDKVQLTADEAKAVEIAVGCPRCNYPDAGKGVDLKALAECVLETEIENAAAIIVRGRLEEWQKEGGNIKAIDLEWFLPLLEELRAK